MRHTNPRYRLTYAAPGEQVVLRCRLVHVERRPEGARVLLEEEGETFLADLQNPEALRGDLPNGAEIEVALGGPGGTQAELRIAEGDRLCPELVAMVGRSYGTIFGSVAQGEDGAWSYLRLEERLDRDLLLMGPIELRGPVGFLLPPGKSWEFRKRLVDRLGCRSRPSPLRVLEWVAVQDGGVDPRASCIRELAPADLVGEGPAALAADASREHYWSESFDADFYVAQARAGLIATAWGRGGDAFLMPQLQAEYALLDWGQLHRSRSLERLFRSGKLELLGYCLEISPDVAPILDELDRRWGSRSWLLPKYRSLMLELADRRRGDFRLHGVGLWVAGEERPVAGELGYSIGRTYTSLSGFHRLEKREWSDLGKVQLHLLAKRLMDSGYAFWNLGHAKMQYKLDLGARIVPRGEFLERWSKAVAEADPGLAG